MTNRDASRDDEVKHAILEFLHKKRSTPRSVKGAKVGIKELRSALKKKGMSQQEVVRNLLYLIESGWVEEKVEQKQIRSPQGIFPSQSQKYMITNQGMEIFDEQSTFSKRRELAGINIGNVSGGIVNIGDNNYNIIRSENKQLYKSLEQLENEIRITDQLSDEEKVNYRAEIQTIQSQLSKLDPDKNIIRSAWDRIKGADTITSLTSSIITIGTLIAQYIS